MPQAPSPAARNADPRGRRKTAMLNVFSLAQGRLTQQDVQSADALTQVQPVWVDLEAPTAEEVGWIRQRFGLEIPRDRKSVV